MPEDLDCFHMSILSFAKSNTKPLSSSCCHGQVPYLSTFILLSGLFYYELNTSLISYADKKLQDSHKQPVAEHHS